MKPSTNEAPKTEPAPTAGSLYDRIHMLAQDAIAATEARHDEHPEHRKLDIDVRIGCPHDHAIVAVKEEIAVEPVGPGLDSEEKTQQRGAVGDHPWKRGQTGAEGEVTLHKIDCAGEKGTQERASAASNS